MAVLRKRIGTGFATELVFGSAKGTMDAGDFLDTLKAHQEAGLWTIQGRLGDIEQKAAELRENQSSTQEGRPVGQYAKEALTYVRLVRDEVAAGNCEAAAYLALRLGSLWRELELKI